MVLSWYRKCFVCSSRGILTRLLPMLWYVRQHLPGELVESCRRRQPHNSLLLEPRLLCSCGGIVPHDHPRFSPTSPVP